MYYGNFDDHGNGTGNSTMYGSSGCGLLGTPQGDGYGHESFGWLSFERRGPVLIVSGFGAGPLGFSTGDGRAPTENWPTSE